MGNQVKKTEFSKTMLNAVVQEKLNGIFKGDKNAQMTFTTALTSAVNTNPDLAECDNGTILNSALIGTSLNLAVSPQIGHFYMVPFNDKKNNRKTATFVLGYKGYLQLAIRSGQFKKIKALPIKEGELIKFDPLTDDYEFNIETDHEKREKLKTIGYYGFFRLNNGYEKTIYWSKEKMQKHASKYSQTYKKDIEKGWTNSFWSKDFDAQACKTIIRQLLSKGDAPMSVEIQRGFEEDNRGMEAYENPAAEIQMISPAPVNPTTILPEQQEEIKALLEHNNISEIDFGVWMAETFDIIELKELPSEKVQEVTKWIIENGKKE